MPVIWDDNFETDKGWTLNAAAVWERGSPGSTPPGSAHQGSNVIATDLDANYLDDILTVSYATSPGFSCVDYENVELIFYRHLEVENEENYDTVTVEVYNGSWNTIWTSDTPPARINDSAWTLIELDISAYVDDTASIQIRFSLRSDGSVNARGWFIDSLSIEGDSLLRYEITGGITKDKVGSALGSCHCFLYKDDGDNTLTYVAYQLSNVSTGAYTFGGLLDNDPNYLVYMFKDDSPHVFDVTDHVLTPTLE